MMTLEYNQTVRITIEQYLSAVRDRLKASASVDVQEVIDDLRNHIERELSQAPQPATQGDITEVLERLGPPENVVDEADMAWWRKTLLHLRRGPEDWRLAYLSLGVLVIGILVAAPLGLLGSFLLSRAALSVATTEPDPPAKKWLIYPSLIIVYAFILCAGLIWPVALGGLVADVLEHSNINGPHFDHNGLGIFLAAFAGGGLALAAWWSLLWFVGHTRPALLRAIFHPFAQPWIGRLFAKATLLAWTLTILTTAATAFLWFTS